MDQKRPRNTVRSPKSTNRLNEYQEGCNQLEREGIIEQINQNNDISKALCEHYLPHRAVLKDNSTTKIEDLLKSLAMKTRCTLSHKIHLSCSKGGAALPESRSLLDIHAVSHAFRLLASHDPNISGVAAESLRSVVRKKLLRDPTPGECCDFLNGKKDGDFARESGDISTQWSRARHSIQRLSCAIKFEWLFI
ncbi:hypothetical protein NPIL_538651 [Nephila pilipes]|uniref:Uncharacterized protein n=1 Tax=Nephila pilipes TaxID=299642 RepID=A0A8X6NUS4_NEPPI|nr:hypothetical protein NPIL_538651 [Nephila pilipes]